MDNLNHMELDFGLEIPFLGQINVRILGRKTCLAISQNLFATQSKIIFRYSARHFDSHDGFAQSRTLPNGLPDERAWEDRQNSVV